MNINIEYDTQIVKSPQGNDCIKLTITNEGKTKEMFGHEAEIFVHYNQYWFGEEFVECVKKLKKMTDKAYYLKK